MSSSPLLHYALRAAQALFATIALGLTITLIHGHHWGPVPTTLGFAAFVGVISLLGAAAGFASHTYAVLEGKVGILIDGVVAVANMAAGILLAIKLRGVSCRSYGADSSDKLAGSEILNGGCRAHECYYFLQREGWPGHLVARCREARADMVFLFLVGGVVGGCGVLAWRRGRRGY
ncbi:hypothetical protein P153DRAFT_421320 [Dothidotthia symphoricarpi CBS 119687]|uniref:MARVEL domain-containing protein n=1 Tax=Dothidotthia symphoricarpi CBS 119687 TaxID=1392245 RepID=A0A6A6ALC1_9PLEO|nr:uncharacterized protein P153DRAFT_421320 [Dothidotthia symphoricarpi CBS 119687]KAF2132366.1 hypothetical protein P153DRAFT_421320 [Dothidotthia symphoricarpi CBS 119687]